MNEKENRREVLEAVDNMITAFSKHDRENYFAAFAEHATFLFHNLDRLLTSRAEYEAVWKKWEEENQFRILACRSTDHNLQMLGEVAIFTHNVSTDVIFDSKNETNNERETIVFARDNSGCWLGVHEHLSIGN
jgi:ketosteroid isomerase-like protein